MPEMRIVVDHGGLKRVDKAVLAFLQEKLAEDIAADARRNAPVDTGRLRNSIEVVPVDDKTVSVVATAPYAAHVELGTSDTRAQPFLKPAAYRKRS